MEKLEYYKLVNKALCGDKEAREEWAKCQVAMVSQGVSRQRR